MNRKVLRPRPDSAHWLHKNCGSRTGFFNSFARNHVYRSDQQSLKNRSMRKSRIDSEFALIAVIFIDYKNRLGFFDVYNWLLIAAIISPVPIMCIYLMYYQHSQGNSIHPLFKRNPDLWGPRSRANRTEAERAERMIRKWW
ncbi:hypothetical protein Y032_0211g2216 [Ancylostoma ceylanicum]|uniref:Uncharacterized protein n=1 Tax=Ancylostoma ceylanicum TaxID=53326 RepID=A0A016SKE8_9BILA|nr:hypothetical protein Y032_0211g2216 [Ancylostoma ceylanicum]